MPIERISWEITHTCLLWLNWKLDTLFRTWRSPCLAGPYAWCKLKIGGIERKNYVSCQGTSLWGAWALSEQDHHRYSEICGVSHSIGFVFVKAVSMDPVVSEKGHGLQLLRGNDGVSRFQKTGPRAWKFNVDDTKFKWFMWDQIAQAKAKSSVPRSILATNRRKWGAFAWMHWTFRAEMGVSLLRYILLLK